MQERIQEILPNLYSSLVTMKLKHSSDSDYHQTVEKCKQTVFDSLSELSQLFENDFALFERNLKDLLSLLERVNISTDLLIEYFIFHLNIVVNNIQKYTSYIPSNKVDDKLFFNISLELMSDLAKKSVGGINFEEYYLNFDKYSFEDLLGTLHFLLSVALRKLETEKLDDENLNHLITILSTAKEISRQTSQLDNYYLYLTALTENLNRSDNKPLALKLARSLLLASFNDSKVEYGYYLLFCAFKGQSNINGSLLSIIICLKVLLLKGKGVNIDLIFCIVWQSLQLFTHEKLLKNPFDIYNNLSKDFLDTDSKKFRIDSVYFDSLFLNGDINLSRTFIAYLDSNIESIMKDDIIPWLIMIYHIDREYNDDPEIKNNIINYKNRFEAILPEDVYRKRKTIIYGKSNELAEILIESLLRIRDSNERTFYAYNVKTLLHTASRLIEYGYNSTSFKDFNLAMLVKADLSYSEAISPALSSQYIHIKDYPIEEFISKYEDVNICKNLLQSVDDAVIFIGQSEGTVYEMIVTLYNVNFHKLHNWDSNNYYEWINKHLPNLKLETTHKVDDPIRRRHEVRDLLFEEHIQHSDIIKSKLNFAKISVEKKSNLLLIKDLYLSAFPHNLLLDENGEFILINTPITDVIGLDWINEKTKANDKIDDSFNVQLWIPIEAGDRTLIQLESNLDEVVRNHNIEVFKSETLNSPLESEINIVSAHGGESISDFPAFMLEENYFVLNMNKVVGKGKILIMLVCHSGSEKQSKGKGQIDSLARAFLYKGYQAVIAPFWTLHIYIPPIWLPEFLDCLKEGYNVSEACYLANRKVYEHYPTPTAWASMHLYGNPFLSI